MSSRQVNEILMKLNVMFDLLKEDPVLDQMSPYNAIHHLVSLIEEENKKAKKLTIVKSEDVS